MTYFASPPSPLCAIIFIISRKKKLSQNNPNENLSCKIAYHTTEYTLDLLCSFHSATLLYCHSPSQILHRIFMRESQSTTIDLYWWSLSCSAGALRLKCMTQKAAGQTPPCHVNKSGHYKTLLHRQVVYTDSKWASSCVLFSLILIFKAMWSLSLFLLSALRRWELWVNEIKILCY